MPDHAPTPSPSAHTASSPSQATPCEPSPPAAPRGTRRWLRRVALALLVLVLLLGSGLVWLCSGSGQRWLRLTLSDVLTSALAPQGLSLELHTLDGLPFAPRVGLTGRDSQGVWLDVPELELRWGLSLAEMTLRVEALRLHGGGLYRLPLLPESPPLPPEQDSSAGQVADAICAGVADVLDVLASLPVPQVTLRGLDLQDVALPAIWLCVEPPEKNGVPQVDTHQLPRVSLSGELLAALGADAQVDADLRAGVTWPAEAVRRSLLRESRPLTEDAVEEDAPVDAPTLLAALLPVSCLGKGEVALRLQARHGQTGWHLQLENLQVAAGMTRAGLRLTLELPDAVTRWADAARIALELDAAVQPLPRDELVAALGGEAQPLVPTAEAASAPPDSTGQAGDEPSARSGDVSSADASPAEKASEPLPPVLSLSWGDLFAGLTQARLVLDGPLLTPHLSVRADSPGLHFDHPATRDAAPVPADVKKAGTTPQTAAPAQPDLARISASLESYPLRWRQALEGLPSHAAVRVSVLCKGTPVEAGFRFLSGVGSPLGRLGAGESRPFAGFLAVDDVQVRAAGAQLTGDWLLAFAQDPSVAASADGLSGTKPAASLPVAASAVAAPVPAVTTAEASGASGPSSAADDPLARAVRDVMAAFPYMRGALSGEVTDWKALAKPLSLLLPGAQADGAVTRLELRAGRPDVDAAPCWRVRLDAPQGRLRGAGGLSLGWRKVTVAAEMESEGDLSLQLDAGMEALDVASLQLRQGRVRARGDISGPVTLEAGVSGDMRLDSRLRWEPGHVNVERLQFSLPAQGIGLTMADRARLEYGPTGWRFQHVDMRVVPSGRLRLEGGLSPEKVHVRLTLDKTDLGPWQTVVSAMPAGSVSLEARLDGQPSQPQGQFSLRAEGLAVRGASLAPLDLGCRGRLQPAGKYSRLQVELDIPESTRRALGAEQVEARLQLPLAFAEGGMPSLPPQAALGGHVRWQGRVGPLWQLVPTADRRLHGRLDIRADASGTVQAPVISGAVHLTQGRFEDVALGVLLQDMDVAAELGRTALHSGLDALGNIRMRGSFTDGHKGRVHLDGELRDKGRRVRLDGQISQLRPLRRRDLMVQLSGSFGVSGLLAGPDIRADISVDTGELRIDRITTASSVTTLPIEDENTVTSGVKKITPPGSLNVRVRTPGRFVVRGRGLESRWQADVRLFGPLADPRILGSVEAVEGQFSLLGAEFLLHRGLVRFAGGAISNPLLDVVLRHETPDLTADVRLGGSVQQLKLSLSSTPSLPQEEIISRIMFGRSSNELGRFENLRLAAAVAELAGFGGDSLSVLEVARKALGVDVLRVGSSRRGFSSSGDQDEDDSALQAGKYIGERLYLGVEQGLKSESTAVVIELQLTPRSKAEVRTEQDNTSAGVRWKYNY